MTNAPPAQKQPPANPSQAAVSEYCAAAEAASVPTPPPLACLCVELLLQQGLPHQALQLLRGQQSALGLPLAARLIEEGACGGAASASPSGGSSGTAAAAVAASAAGGKLPGLACQMALEVVSRQAAAEAHHAGKAGGTAGRGAGGNGGGGRGVMAAAAAAVAGVAPGAAAAAAASAALSQAGRRRALQHNETYVRQLVASGQLLRAARLVRDRGLGAAAPGDELLAAAAARGDARLFAALYRMLGGQRVGGDVAAGEGVEAAMRRMAVRGRGSSGGGAAVEVA